MGSSVCVLIMSLSWWWIISLSSAAPSVHQILPQFGLPSGLLPSSVESYNLSDDGTFSVVLHDPCFIQFEYLIYYDESITGKLRYGSITQLKGIQVRRFYMWFDVDEIKVDLPPSDFIYFQIGLLNKKLDVAQFLAVHGCRCAPSFQHLFSLPPPIHPIDE